LKTKGRTEVSFTVKSISTYYEVPTVIDGDGHTRPQWEWFEREFVQSAPKEFNAVGLHFGSREKEWWKITPALNGSYHQNSDNVLGFWVCADAGKKARHYAFSEFVRILIHEIQHGDVHWTNADRGLVHRYDYVKRAIQKLPAKLSYVKYDSLMGQLTALLNKLKPMKKTFLQECEAALGTDVTPDDLVPDTVACAITVSTLKNKTDATFPKVAGTWTLYDVLEHRTDHVRVTTPEPGDVVISPTGMGNGSLSNGHVGVVGRNGKIMSNDSATGKFESNYDLMSWDARYRQKGGFPVLYYRKK
jgi:hypothetical protein